MKLGNGEFMGQKLKFAPVQQRKNDNGIRSHVCNSLTADFAGEAKVRFLVLMQDETVDYKSFFSSFL